MAKRPTVNAIVLSILRRFAIIVITADFSQYAIIRVIKDNNTEFLGMGSILQTTPAIEYLLYNFQLFNSVMIRGMMK